MYLFILPVLEFVEIKLKMSNLPLLDWFADCKKEVYIKERKQVIQHVCFYPSDGETSPDTLYIGGMKEFLGGDRAGVLCVHGKDTLKFPGLDSTAVFDVYNKTLAAFDYYKDWDEKLKLMIFRGCTIRAMLDESREIFQKNPIVVMDASYMVLGTAIPSAVGAENLEYYYFQTKDTIIRSIYYDFIETIDSYLYQTKPEIFLNRILSHAVSSRIYYDIILNDEHNRRVYYEVLEHNSNYGILDTYADKIYHQYIEDNNIIITDELLKIYTHMNFGARREFFIQYFNGVLNLSVQDLVTVINGLIPRLFKLDQNFVDRLMMDSILIFDTLDYDEFKFLI